MKDEGSSRSKRPNSEILKLLHKCPLMCRSIAVNNFSIVPYADSAAPKPPVRCKLLTTENICRPGKRTAPIDLRGEGEARPTGDPRVSFLLDTDICSAYLKNDRRVIGKVMLQFGGLHVSVVTVGELLTWARHSGRAGRQEDPSAKRSS
jgi:hypothetical protein